ncbi:hypothetical protein C5167_024737 [Papaver somniferum]|uniref:Uncharacterized protein n=1 Tax=Papaver somniferum TaxID=3469 RepID=A0A4Y7JSI0_PAPSO|nr:hypothetical protein C5167_024737 [Papaver somniferum]
MVGAKDLLAEPAEEEFRFGLRSGLIRRIALNKVQPGAVPKDSLVAMQKAKFDASDLERGKLTEMVVCWLLGNGCLFSYIFLRNLSMHVFPKLPIVKCCRATADSGSCAREQISGGRPVATLPGGGRAYA